MRSSLSAPSVRGSQERTSSPLGRERDRLETSVLAPEDPSSSSTKVWPTFRPELGLRPESNLFKPPAGADEVRLPIPGRCGASVGMAWALSLEARSRRDCWEVIAEDGRRRL